MTVVIKSFSRGWLNGNRTRRETVPSPKADDEAQKRKLLELPSIPLIGEQ